MILENYLRTIRRDKKCQCRAINHLKVATGQGDWNRVGTLLRLKNVEKITRDKGMIGKALA